MPRFRLISTLLVSLLAAPAFAQQPSEAPDPWAAPPIDRAVSVIDTRTGQPVPFESMLDELAAADAVFLGETHIDETTHRVELAVLQGLDQRRNHHVVLALEMFDRDVQPILNQYLASQIDEPTFLADARPWAQYRAAYRPLIEHAKASALPVIASNFPRPLTRRISMEGLAFLDTLDAEQRATLPAQILPNTPEYWRRVDNAVRGHLAMMGEIDSPDARLASTQSLWDNAMGDAVALALDAHPGSAVLHVNGAFHSAYRQGTVHQFRLRKPDATVLTVDIATARNPAVADPAGNPDNPTADFLVFAEARATDLNEGTHTVALDRALDYRLHVPDSATADSPVPLLIWLPGDGLTAQDGLDLWIDRLGDDAAIAVLEPPYRARMPDLSEGGRWFWPDSFPEDVFSAAAATERVWAYLLRNHPVDPDRVVVAGEGTGATVVAANALYTDRSDHTAFAFEPKRYAKLKDVPLPLPEYTDRSNLTVSLTVFGPSRDHSWWNTELAAHRENGSIASFEELASWPDESQNAAIREALALPALSTAPESEPFFMVVSADTPRAWHWSRLYALEQTANSFAQRVTLVAPNETHDFMSAQGQVTPEISPETSADSIPKCPGPFGGTTVLVLPEDLTDEQTQNWLDLETNDPLNAKSRFHRLRIARAGPAAGDRALPALLATLESENRNNVLILPAVFCADAVTMQALERLTRDAADRMTLQWRPGLGP